MAAELLPEFFLFLGIDLFVVLALLTCVMEHFSRLVSYLYEAAAIFGYINMLMSREFMANFGEYMRFSYSFLYLGLALANIVGVNAYLLVWKKAWTTAKVFASCVTFPLFLISAFFFTLYSTETAHILTAALVTSATILGIGIAFLVAPGKIKEKLGR